MNAYALPCRECQGRPVIARVGIAWQIGRKGWRGWVVQSESPLCTVCTLNKLYSYMAVSLEVTR